MSGCNPMKNLKIASGLGIGLMLFSHMAFSACNSSAQEFLIAQVIYDGYSNNIPPLTLDSYSVSSNARFQPNPPKTISENTTSSLLSICYNYPTPRGNINGQITYRNNKGTKCKLTFNCEVATNPSAKILECKNTSASVDSTNPSDLRCTSSIQDSSTAGILLSVTQK